MIYGQNKMHLMKQEKISKKNGNKNHLKTITKSILMKLIITKN